MFKIFLPYWDFCVTLETSIHEHHNWRIKKLDTYSTVFVSLGVGFPWIIKNFMVNRRLSSYLFISRYAFFFKVSAIDDLVIRLFLSGIALICNELCWWYMLLGNWSWWVVIFAFTPHHKIQPQNNDNSTNHPVNLSYLFSFFFLVDGKWSSSVGVYFDWYLVFIVTFRETIAQLEWRSPSQRQLPCRGD